MNKKIVHLVNRITPTSIPIDIACNLQAEFEVVVISLYDDEEEAQAKREINQMPVRVIGIGLKNKFHISRYLGFIKHLKDINPQVIHTHHTFSGFLGRLAGKLFSNSLVVTTIHTDMRFLNRYQSLLRIITLNLADYIIFNSENTKNSFSKFQRFVKNSNDSRVIYNGVNFDQIISQRAQSGHIRESYGIDDSFMIGSVGRLEKAKDHRTLIKAFKIFKEKAGPVKLIIVGNGSLERELKNLVKSLELENDIIFTGQVLRKDVYEIINALDMFVVSSRYEGFCNAMVEAMAAGNPIVASNVQPLPEVLGEGNGLFFEVTDDKDLAEKMLLLYNDRELRDELSRKAKGYALNNYSLEKCINDYSRVYRRLLG